MSFASASKPGGDQGFGGDINGWIVMAMVVVSLCFAFLAGRWSAKEVAQYTGTTTDDTECHNYVFFLRHRNRAHLYRSCATLRWSKNVEMLQICSHCTKRKEAHDLKKRV